MAFPLGAVPLQAGGDALSTFLDLLPLIVLIVVLAGFMMWILAWMSRYFEYLKTVESAWLDRPTLDFVHRTLEGVWILITTLVVLGLAATRSSSLHDLLAAFVLRVPAVFVFIFVMFAGAIIVRVLHRFAAFLRGELKAKPKRVAPESALAFAEIVLKYVIYLAALFIAVLGALRSLPASDQATIQANIGALPAVEPTIFLEVVLGVVLIILADRFVDSIFEDLKRRSKKWNARIVDEVKSMTRYGVWVIGAVVLFFIVLDLMLSEGGLVVFAVGFIALLVIVGVLGFDTARNLLSGLAVLRADLFDIGDRVKIGEDLVGDVASMGLTLTQLRTLRGEMVQIPNGRLLQETVLNFSRSKPYALFVEVSVAFGVGHERVRDLLLKAAAETDGIVRDHGPEVYGKDLDGGHVVYQLYAYTDQPERMKEIKSSLIYRIQDLFGNAGITM